MVFTMDLLLILVVGYFFSLISANLLAVKANVFSAYCSSS